MRLSQTKDVADMRNENDTLEVQVITPPKLKIGNKEFGRYCERSNKLDAQAIREDLVSCGCESVIRRDNGCFVVWWAR